jgi:hypothetical protein
MANAKISIPGGVSVDLEGTAEEVAAVLENLRKAQGSSIATTTGPAPAGPKGKGEIPRLIDSLKLEDYFRTPRGLSEIQRKLAEIGHHYPLTTLSGAMVSQSRSRSLRRFKQQGKYVYVQ